MMFGGRKKGKSSGIVPVTTPAQVFAELPVLPRPTQPHVREEWGQEGVGRVPAVPSAPVVPGVLAPASGAAGRAGAAVRGGAAVGAAGAGRGAVPRYAMVFSDGQRVPVGTRCGAGRMPPKPDEGYAGFALLHDATQQISRRHFEFGVTSLGQVWVMDCDSANGTWLESQGTRIQLPKTVRVGMAAGDVVRFGGMRAKLEKL